MKTVPIAKALILDADGHMLVLRRSQTHPTLAGHADLPGGLIEPGEEPGSAVAREILEETGLTIAPVDLVLSYAETEAHNDENRVRLLYIVRLKEKQPNIAISWEHEAADWLPVSELAHIETEFHSFYHDALHYIREHDLLSEQDAAS